MHIVLERLGRSIRAIAVPVAGPVDGVDAAADDLTDAELPGYVAARERAAANEEHPRWVWNDTRA